MVDNTKFEDVYKLFLNSLQDYTLVELFKNETEVAIDMMELFLLKAIPKFRVCRKNLKDVDLDNKEFYDVLDLEEKVILSDLMILSWLERLVQDITQMNLNLNDLDFKHFSEERNLREKSEFADRQREKADYEMLQYDLYHTPFSQWGKGDYGLWS